MFGFPALCCGLKLSNSCEKFRNCSVASQRQFLFNINMNDLISEEIVQEMLEKVPKTTSRYVSCIRLDGSPILPPLIDDKYRGELTHYRNLAILVEKKISDRKKLKDNRHSVDSGVMIGVSNGEPSWLRPCSLQPDRKELMTPSSFDSDKNKSSCGTHCVQRSNSSDDTCSKNFICDHDVWRYISNCDEHFCTAWFDHQNEELLSNFDPELIANSGNHNFPEKITSSCNINAVPHDEFYTKEGNNISNKSGNSVDTASDEVNRLSVYYAEYHKGINEQSSHPKNTDLNEKHETNVCEMFNSYNCERVSQIPGGNCNVFDSQIITESDYLNRCVSDETSTNCVDDGSESALNGESEISGYEQYFVNYSAMSDRFTNLNCSFKSNVSKDLSSRENDSCNTNKSRRELKSSLGTSLNKADVVNQESLRAEVKINSTDEHCPLLKHISGNKLSSIKISCSSISLPEYPSGLPTHVLEKQKPEKPYNPKYYGGCNSVDTENSKETLCPNMPENIPRKWLCENVTNIVSDDSCEELSKNTAAGSSPFLETSLACQKHNLDVPLSESVSISEVDFHTSSVATIAPDTSEEANELPKHSSVEKDDELTPPKLVRQNSYTLITPSPVLLAHAKANEKQEEKTSSEDDNHNNHIQTNKNEEHDKAKGDWNSKNEVKNVYIAPSEKSQILAQNVKNSDAAQAKGNCSQRIKNMSLPGSCVSSPVKVSLFHSSLDNLPIVTVRRFQELIDSQSIQNQPCESSKTNIFTAEGNSSGKNTLNTRSSSLDLEKFNEPAADSRLKCRSKSDLQDSKCKQSTIINSPCTEGSGKSKKDVEILFREMSFDPSPSSVSHQLDVNYISTPRSNQGNQTNLDNISPGFSLGTSDNQISDNISEKEVIPMCNTLPLNDSTVQQIFLQLQNQHSLLMAQLLDRQKKEQEALANTFLNQQRQILQEMRLIPTPPMHEQSPSANSDTGTSSIEKKSPSAPQEIHTFGSVSVGSHLSSPLEMPLPSGNSDQSRYSSNGEHSETTHHCPRELEFTKPSPVSPKAKPRVTEEQINAATAINAAARGYLVRRLLKTEHVQEIINTISESVQCALQLQRECPVDITPSDVELHRRLIQQLTAACYSLHDTFFALTIQEKMTIIANDRERRRNPASRPVSARTSISAATQKYIQRKQQQNRLSERPATNTRRSWWRHKARACSAGPYEQSSSSYAKQPFVTSKQQQSNNRATRRPWR
ncbi:Centriolar coiled-coil protein of 110 kDa [Gryllus bimaculatus]|nr:Centriolar coiled-coil protein of 110 kDa [Gryllus bimaculatus]